MKKPPLLLLALLAAAGGCRPALMYATPIADDGAFSAPGAEVLPSAAVRYRLAAAYSAERHGLAVLVIEGGRIVFEAYQNGHTAEKPIHLWSGTKSFAGAMAIAARADGILDLDERVGDTVPELREDPRKAKITVRHLLSFTSGIAQDFFRLTRDGLLAKQRVANKYALALTLGVRTEPGEAFKYGSSHLMVFGELMRRKLDGDPLAYLERRVFKPIGFRYAGWNRDPVGNPMLPYGAWTTAREWAKFGMLVADDGYWKGTEVLPDVALCFEGSAAMPAYGLTFWLNEKIPESSRKALPFGLRHKVPTGRALYEGGPTDLVAAAGFKDNRLYVAPSRKLVVVRLADGDREFDDAAFLGRLFDGKEL